MVMESMEIGDKRRRTSVLLFEIESNQGFTCYSFFTCYLLPFYFLGGGSGKKMPVLYQIESKVN